MTVPSRLFLHATASAVTGNWLTLAVEATAIIAFAVSGLAQGLRRRMDPVGLTTVAFVTAFGGGTLRDVLLDRRPFFWVERVEYVWLVFVLVALAPLAARRVAMLPEAVLQWPDALGLGLFAASGTTLAQQAGMPDTVAALMGVITAVFGGVLRDLLCNRLPAALSDHRPYALCAFAGAWVLIGLRALGHSEPLAAAAGTATATALRLLALARGWRLPALEPRRMGDGSRQPADRVRVDRDAAGPAAADPAAADPVAADPDDPGAAPDAAGRRAPGKQP